MTSGWNGSAQKLCHKISGGSPGGLFYDPSISYASKSSFYGLLVGFNHLEAWLLISGLAHIKEKEEDNSPNIQYRERHSANPDIN